MSRKFINMKSLHLIQKIFATLFLLGFILVPSTLAMDNVLVMDTSHDILNVGISDPSWIAAKNK